MIQKSVNRLFFKAAVMRESFNEHQAQILTDDIYCSVDAQ